MKQDEIAKIDQPPMKRELNSFHRRYYFNSLHGALRLCDPLKPGSVLKLFSIEILTAIGG